MIKLVKKYVGLYICGVVSVSLITTLILTIFPDLLVFDISETAKRTYGVSYLKAPIWIIINTVIAFIMNEDMKKNDIKSKTILLITPFSSSIGIVCFLILIGYQKIVIESK